MHDGLFATLPQMVNLYQRISRGRPEFATLTRRAKIPHDLVEVSPAHGSRSN